MNRENRRRAEDLSRDRISMLSPRFGEILGPGAGGAFGGGARRPPARRDGGSGAIYHPGVLISHDRFADGVAGFLGRKEVRFTEPQRLLDDRGFRLRHGRPSGPPMAGLADLIAFELAEVDSDTRERDALELARLLKREAADPASPVPEDVVVGPLHVMTLAQTPSIGPGTDPLPADLPDAPPRGPDGLDAASVGVVDTGLWEEAAAWSFVDGELEDPVPTPNAVVPFRGSGHGGFIAWLLHCVTPDAQVHVKNAFTAFDPDDPTGGLTEVAVVHKVNELIADGYRIINLSLGTKVDTAFGVDPVVLRAAIEEWRKIDGLLVVAAAGNDASDSPWYPAGYAADRRYRNVVVSVGALDGEGHRRARPPHSRVASFSNHGPWVTAWAPGVDLVAAYPRDVKFEYKDDVQAVVATETFPTGMARWSGTSFAAPVVAAQVAARAAGGDARQAWRELRDGRPFVVMWPEWWEGDGEPCPRDE